jgi:energy-coupling factor transporter ATP-binding protein EcfA2
MSIRPELIVLDEPCTGMDSSLKEEFLYYLKSLISTYELASIYVSHHWDEMAFLSDTILYLSREGEAKESAKPILTPVGEFCTNPPTISAFRAVFGPQSTLLALNKVSDRRYEGGLNSLSSSDSVYVLGCGPFVTGNPTSKAIREPIRVMHGNCRDRFFRVAFAASAYSALNLAGPTGVVGTIYTNEMASDCVSVQIEMRNGDPWLIANSLL